MDLPKAQHRIKEQHETTKYQFVLTELDLAITFGEIALSAKDEWKAERNEINAKRAYSVAKHFFRDASFTGKMNREIAPRLARIERLLRRLGKQRGQRFAASHA